MTLLESMQTCGVDTEATLRRFGNNSGLLERFVLKFPQDPTFSSLTEAIPGEDFELMERLAHTLKGTSANLGYQELSDRCAALVAALRGGQREGLAGLFQPISEEYQRVVGAIGQIR